MKICNNNKYRGWERGLARGWNLHEEEASFASVKLVVELPGVGQQMPGVLALALEHAQHFSGVGDKKGLDGPNRLPVNGPQLRVPRVHILVQLGRGAAHHQRQRGAHQRQTARRRDLLEVCIRALHALGVSAKHTEFDRLGAATSFKMHFLNFIGEKINSKLSKCPDISTCIINFLFAEIGVSLH